MDIKSKQDALDKQYIELGKHYYEMNKEGEVDNAGIANVSTLTNEIAALQAEILKIQRCLRMSTVWHDTSGRNCFLQSMRSQHCTTK